MSNNEEIIHPKVTTAFRDYEVLAFQMNNTGLHDLVYIKPKSLSEDDIIRTLKTKLRCRKAQIMWSPAKSKKVDMEGDMFGLNLSMHDLVESQKRGNTGAND